MKNRTAPIQKFREFTKEMKSNDKLELELGPNEFTDKTGRIGLFSFSDPEPYNFLTIERYEWVDLKNYQPMENTTAVQTEGSESVYFTEDT